LPQLKGKRVKGRFKLLPSSRFFSGSEQLVSISGTLRGIFVCSHIEIDETPPPVCLLYRITPGVKSAASEGRVIRLNPFHLLRR
jgi:hypothetical protein